MMFSEFLSLIDRYASNCDHTSALRLYHAFCKEIVTPDEEQACQYILAQLPKPRTINIRSVLEKYGQISDTSVWKASRWVQQNGNLWQDTLCGVYVTECAAQKLRAFLSNAIPVITVFERVCSDITISYKQALFAEFCRKSRKQLLHTQYHPFCLEQWYWIGKDEDLCELVRQWYIAYSVNIPSDIEGYLSVLEAATAIGIQTDKLLRWILAHNSSYIYHHGQCLISMAKVTKLRERWNDIQPLAPIVKRKMENIPVHVRKHAQTKLNAWLDSNKHEWILPAGTLPQQQEGLLYTENPVIAEQEMDVQINTYPTIAINRLKQLTGMPVKLLKLKACSGAVAAEEVSPGIWYISKNEYRRIVLMHEQYITLDEIVLSIVKNTDSTFLIESHVNRDNLINHCNNHEWWGVQYTESENLPMNGRHFNVVLARVDAELVTDKLFLWVQGYGQSYQQKFQSIVSRYTGRYPYVINQLIEYEAEVHPVDKAFLDMACFLFELVPKDLHEMTEDEIEQVLIGPFSQMASLSSCEILSEFLLFARFTKRHFTFAGTSKTMDRRAYPIKDYAVMMAYVANDDIIQKSSLISKAISNKKYADIWLFVALHMYAAWRSTDYMRMIAPAIPYAPQEMLERIKNAEIRPDEFRAVAEWFIETNRLALDKPNKTKGTPGVSDLYFCCPQSCLETFGTILSIAVAHHLLTPNAGAFVNPVRHWTVINQFFGHEFLAACGNRSFSGQRANKSLLQCVELVGREGEKLSPTVSYFLASIVRSHKLSYGKLSDTTDIYLRDAAFSGLTPEYVIYQMWERGVCSFITDVLCKKCYGDQYSCLPIAQQTAVIKSVGLTPAQTANILQSVQYAEDAACEAIQTICQSRESMEQVLQQIAMGHGSGKNYDVFCLCKAAGMDCNQKRRLNCMGCKYEIRTKAMLLRYAVNHQKLMQTDGLSETEIRRRIYLCKTTTYPAIQEILVHLESGTDDDEYSIYRKLIQEVTKRGIAGSHTQ